MILRTKRRARFAAIPNETAEDSRLSYRARGILVFLLAKPDDWETNIEHLTASSDKEGRDAIRTAIHELMALGYVVREIRKDKDKLKGYNYTVYDTVVGLPADGLPVDGKPAHQKSATNKTHSNKTHITIPTKTMVSSKEPTRASKEMVFEIAQIIGTPKALPLTERVNALRTRLKTFTFEEIKTAAKSMAKDEFLIGKTDRNTKNYLTLDYVLRGDKNIDKYLNETNSIDSDAERLRKKWKMQ